MEKHGKVTKAEGSCNKILKNSLETREWLTSLCVTPQAHIPYVCRKNPNVFKIVIKDSLFVMSRNGNMMRLTAFKLKTNVFCQLPYMKVMVFFL